MLEDSEQSPMGMSEKRAERCKPDYETMIASLRIRREKTSRFKVAALEYFEGKRARGKMAELIGELVTECNMFDGEINKLLKAQENDQE